tara:strand:+ start:47 stop:397 length:351 start_codon:yes stop_codon:yes gene_type:complete
MSVPFPTSIPNPTYNTKISPNPKVNVISFGDGFEQRLSSGLNQNPITVNLVFEVSQTDANTAINFLNERIVDGSSFTYTLPNESNERKFVCESYPRTIPFLNRVKLTCVFREVFEA